MNEKRHIRGAGNGIVVPALLIFVLAPGQAPAMESSAAEVEERVGVLEQRVADLEREREVRTPASLQSSGARERPDVRFLCGAASQTEPARFWPDYWARLKHSGH